MSNDLNAISSSETQAIIDLASQITPVEIAGQDHIRRVALPPGWTLSEKNDEHLRLHPYRKTGAPRLDEQDSFIRYINRHKIGDLTTIYCQADYRQSKVDFECIINDHDGLINGQQWRDHKALYTPGFSEEWKRWIGSDKYQFNQAEFAMFIEENLNDVAAAEGMPTGQQVLEMSLSFQANQDMRYKSSIRLQNGGVDMSFVQDDDDQTLVKMRLFEKVAIGIPVFWGGDAYQITARLRYRVREGKLTFWYELIRADKILEDATETLIGKIIESTGVPLYFGRP